MRILYALVILLALAVPALAEVTVSTSESHYVVQGDTAGKILAFYKARKEKFAATTQPRFKYTFHWVQRGNICSVTGVDVHLHIHYTYPRLANSLKKYNRMWWDKTLKAMVIHERIHGRIAQETAHELEQDLMRIKKVPCSGIKGTVKARANRILQEHSRRQREYDRITEHGVRQERYTGR